MSINIIRPNRYLYRLIQFGTWLFALAWVIAPWHSKDHPGVVRGRQHNYLRLQEDSPSLWKYSRYIARSIQVSVKVDLLSVGSLGGLQLIDHWGSATHTAIQRPALSLLHQSCPYLINEELCKKSGSCISGLPSVAALFAHHLTIQHSQAALFLSIPYIAKTIIGEPEIQYLILLRNLSCQLYITISIYVFSVVLFERISWLDINKQLRDNQDSFNLHNLFSLFLEVRIIRLEIYQVHQQNRSRWVFKSPTYGRPLRSTPSVEKHEVYQCSTLSICMAGCSLSHG
jgi:hypothetical protein